MTRGGPGRGSSRNRVIFSRNSRHYRESGVPLRESAVFYRAAGDQGPPKSQHYRESAPSWRESDVFSRSDGNPGWVAAPGGRRGPPGHLSVPRRGSSSLKRSRPRQNQGNSAISQRRARSAFTKRSLDHERETIFAGRLAKYYEFPRAHRPGARVRVVNYYVNCKVGPACFLPEHESRCFTEPGGVRVPRRPPKPATSPWETWNSQKKHHAKWQLLAKVALNLKLPHGGTFNSHKNITRK